MKATLRTISGTLLAGAGYVVLLLVLAGIVRPWQELKSPRRNGLWSGLLSGVAHLIVVVGLGLYLLPVGDDARPAGTLLTASLSQPEAAIGDVEVGLDASAGLNAEPSTKAGLDDDTAAPFELAGGGEGAPLSTIALPDFNVVHAGTGLASYKGDARGMGKELGLRYSGGGNDAEGAGKGDGGQGQAAGAGDGQSTSFFGSTARGTRFVFIVDASQSMEGLRFPRARAELLRTLESIKPNQEYFVLFYNTDTFPLLDETNRPIRNLIPGTPENLIMAKNWIARATPHGATNPLPAIVYAEGLYPDAIFLLTDGQFVNGFQIAKYLQGLPTPRVPIHTLSFVERSGEEMLRAIAVETGGKYTHVD